MVDRIARDKFAELLRHFAAGNLTNDEYEDVAQVILHDANRNDRSLGAIFSAAWCMYDDLREHRLRDNHALTKDGRRAVARWILFLHSDLEYEWPFTSMLSMWDCLLRACTFGLAGFFLDPMIERRRRRQGPWDLWPFMREGDYQQATASPRLLGGAR